MIGTHHLSDVTALNLMKKWQLAQQYGSWDVSKMLLTVTMNFIVIDFMITWFDT